MRCQVRQDSGFEFYTIKQTAKDKKVCKQRCNAVPRKLKGFIQSLYKIPVETIR